MGMKMEMEKKRVRTVMESGNGEEDRREYFGRSFKPSGVRK